MKLPDMDLVLFLFAMLSCLTQLYFLRFYKKDECVVVVRMKGFFLFESTCLVCRDALYIVGTVEWHLKVRILAMSDETSR